MYLKHAGLILTASSNKFNYTFNSEEKKVLPHNISKTAHQEPSSLLK